MVAGTSGKLCRVGFSDRIETSFIPKIRSLYAAGLNSVQSSAAELDSCGAVAAEEAWLWWWWWE
jgi:hypothetical protein